MDEFMITFPSKKELKSLEKRGLFTLFTPETTLYAKYNSPLLVYPILTRDYNDKTALIYCAIQNKLYPHRNKKTFIRIKMGCNPVIGILPVIKLTPSELEYFKQMRYEKMGLKDFVRFGCYEYRRADYDEEVVLEKELQKGNIVFNGKYDVTSFYSKYANEYIYKGKKYIRVCISGVDLDTIYWIEEQDLEWIVDEEESQLICYNIIDSLNDHDPQYFLEKLSLGFGRQRDILYEEKLLLTPNENKESLPFFVPEKSSENNYFNELINDMDEHSIPNAYVYALGKKDKRVLDSSLFDEKPKYEMGIRPCIEYKYIKDKCTLANPNNKNEVYYGGYPHLYVPQSASIKLDLEYSKGKLNKTNKIFTSYHLSKEKGLAIEKYPEYEYEGKKYIKLPEKYKVIYFGKDSSGNIKSVSEGPIWLEVTPIKWQIDEKTGLAISKEQLFFFSNIDQESEVIIKKINIKDVNNYLRKYFSREIQPLKIKYEVKKEEKTDNNIMSQIISKKKEKTAQIAKLIEGNNVLKKIMKENNLSLSDIELDEKGKVHVKGLII